MGETGRKYIDCREYPSDKKCTLAISGSEPDVMEPRCRTPSRSTATRTRRSSALS
jgi:hypothetical protein